MALETGIWDWVLEIAFGIDYWGFRLESILGFRIGNGGRGLGPKWGLGLKLGYRLKITFVLQVFLVLGMLD